MNFEAALREELAAIPGLATRVYPLDAPEGTKPPYIRYGSSEGVPDRALDTFLDSKQVDCDIDVIAATYKDLKPLASAVAAKLQSMPGRIIGTGGPLVQDVMYDGPVELYEPAVDWYRTNFRVQFYL